MDNVEWNVTNENKLFLAMVGIRPVGANKYFKMALIEEKLDEMDFHVSSDKIWEHLGTMYNLKNFDEQEPLPFPNEEKDFYLPDSDFGAFKEEKLNDKNNVKFINAKRNDTKDAPKLTLVKEIKKDDKIINKKDNNPRRDSKDGKDLKPTVVIKKEIIKKESVDMSKLMKSLSSTSLKEEDKLKTPNRQDEAKRLITRRPTRASIKPEELLGTPLTKKPQSPLTVRPSSVNKRRRN